MRSKPHEVFGKKIVSGSRRVFGNGVQVSNVPLGASARAGHLYDTAAMGIDDFADRCS